MPGAKIGERPYPAPPKTQFSGVILGRIFPILLPLPTPHSETQPIINPKLLSSIYLYPTLTTDIHSKLGKDHNTNTYIPLQIHIYTKIYEQCSTSD